jgi:hypothetical protein
MKQISLFTVLLCLFISCGNNEIDGKALVEKPAAPIKEDLEDTTVIELPELEVREELACTCFHNWNDLEPDDDYILSVKAKTEEDLENIEAIIEERDGKRVETIKIQGSTVVPEALWGFKEVTRIEFDRIGYGGSPPGLENLDNFPKLLELRFEEGRVDFSKRGKWMDRVVHVELQKAVVAGLNSWTRLKALQKLQSKVSTYKGFPSGLDSLSCLRSVIVFETRGNINLSELDFSKSACLESFRFSTSYNTLKGIPHGLDKCPLQTLSIGHRNLSSEERDSISSLVNIEENKSK